MQGKMMRGGEIPFNMNRLPDNEKQITLRRGRDLTNLYRSMGRALAEGRVEDYEEFQRKLKEYGKDAPLSSKVAKLKDVEEAEKREEKKVDDELLQLLRKDPTLDENQILGTIAGKTLAEKKAMIRRQVDPTVERIAEQQQQLLRIAQTEEQRAEAQRAEEAFQEEQQEAREEGGLEGLAQFGFGLRRMSKKDTERLKRRMLRVM